MAENTILLVDDEAGIRKVLGISLQDSGFDVHTAENGKEALRLFEKIAPPIVLTDIKMPDMDGIELLRRIKKKNADVEVIMFTGHGDMDLAIKSLKYEATDFVTKPINDEVLGIALKRARERISMRRQLREYTQNLEKLVEEKAQKLVEAERMAAVGQTVIELSHTIKNIANGLKGSIFVLGKGVELENRPKSIRDEPPAHGAPLMWPGTMPDRTCSACTSITGGRHRSSSNHEKRTTGRRPTRGDLHVGRESMQTTGYCQPLVQRRVKINTQIRVSARIPLTGRLRHPHCPEKSPPAYRENADDPGDT